MKRNVDVPIEMNARPHQPALLGLEAYVKPSVGLQLLRQEIMGPEAFDDAFRTYVRRWAFKHPRRPISSARWKTWAGGGSTGSGASGSSRTRTSTRRSTRW